MVMTKDSQLCEMLERKKIRCLHCNTISSSGITSPINEMTNKIDISCPNCRKIWGSLMSN